MDYIEVATRIAGSEDPYAEFEKEASTLNDIEKTSLARALNKQMFLSRLENRDGDGHLDFDVVIPETIGTHIPNSDTDSNISKVASVNDIADKSLLVTDDMFVLESRAESNYSTPYNTEDLQEITMATAARIAEDKIIKTAEELRILKIEKKAEIEAEIPVLLTSLVKIARDASETRTLIMHVMNANQEDLIPSIVNMSKSRESDIAEASLCDLGEDKVADINEILENIDLKKKMYSTIDSMDTSVDNEVEKVAVPVVKPAIWIGKKIIKGILGTGKFAGKNAYRLASNAKASAGVGAVVGTTMGADTHKEKILRQIM